LQVRFASDAEPRPQDVGQQFAFFIDSKRYAESAISNSWSLAAASNESPKRATVEFAGKWDVVSWQGLLSR
jgi:hypothetical protein